MHYYAVALTTDLRPGTMKAVTADGKQILLANVNGNYFAIQQKCPHMGGDLSKGKLNGAIVTCPRHAAAFNVTTGEAVERASILFAKFKTKNAATFPVRVEGTSVMIGV